MISGRLRLVAEHLSSCGEGLSAVFIGGGRLHLRRLSVLFQRPIVRVIARIRVYADDSPCSLPPCLNTFPVSTSAVKIGSPRAGRFAKRRDYRESHCVRLVRFPLISADSRLARAKHPRFFFRELGSETLNRKSFLGGGE